MRARRLALLPILLVAAACEEEQIAAANPEIHLCPAVDTPTAGCDQALDFGTRFINTAHELSLVVANRGRAPLGLDEVRVDVDWITVELEPQLLNNGASLELVLTATPPVLGENEAVITVTSDDPLRPEAEIALTLFGTPRPDPELEICYDGVCSRGVAEVEIDLGTVRRTQAAATALEIKSVGPVDLQIEDVVLTDGASVPGEISVTGSTRAGALGPDETATLVLTYAPVDGVDDTFTLTILSDDPAAPEVDVIVTGATEPNEPPTAVAAQLDTGLTTVDDATVNTTVAIDGAASFDPEGDPLTYSWTVTGPSGSAVFVQDPAASRALIRPDFAGAYTVRLVVTDSVGQTSAPAEVTVNAIPEAALRLRATWPSGGDLDLQLVPAGDAVFGPTACYFDQPRPDLGVAADASDDPELENDAESGPGEERISYLFPPDGDYELYAHFFDDAAGPAEVTVDVILFDEAPPAYSQTLTFDAACQLWSVGTVSFPAGTFTAGPTSFTDQCAPPP